MNSETLCLGYKKKTEETIQTIKMNKVTCLINSPFHQRFLTCRKESKNHSIKKQSRQVFHSITFRISSTFRYFKDTHESYKH